MLRVKKAVLLPASVLLVQFVLVGLAPSSLSRPAAYVAMVVAPLLAAVALAVRGWADRTALRTSWWALAGALGLWALGAFDNLWQELVAGHLDEMYPVSMLAFSLYGVPLAFVLASEGRTPSRRAARVVDAVLATALGYGFFHLTWALLTARGQPDEQAVHTMLWLLDAQNLYLAVGALARSWAADDATERDLFGAMAWYLGLYVVMNFVNNHFIAGDPRFGVELSSAISLAFAVLATLTLRPPRQAFTRAPSWVVRTVRTASPIMVVSGLLLVSLVLIRLDYALGVAGVLVTVVGYAARTTLSQVRVLQHGETLQRERTALQSLAWTDALTGVPNRRALEQVLHEADPAVPLALMMIDLDYFKPLNDLSGHVAGDACLREVARALQQALARPGDLLARYGGEEFTALLHGVDAAGARVVAERLRAVVERLALTHPGSPFGVVTVSIGVACAARPVVATLVEAADQALYEAKRAGRNRVVEGSSATLDFVTNDASSGSRVK